MLVLAAAVVVVVVEEEVPVVVVVVVVIVAQWLGRVVAGPPSQRCRCCWLVDVSEACVGHRINRIDRLSLMLVTFQCEKLIYI